MLQLSYKQTLLSSYSGAEAELFSYALIQFSVEELGFLEKEVLHSISSKDSYELKVLKHIIEFFNFFTVLIGRPEFAQKIQELDQLNIKKFSSKEYLKYQESLIHEETFIAKDESTSFSKNISLKFLQTIYDILPRVVDHLQQSSKIPYNNRDFQELQEMISIIPNLSEKLKSDLDKIAELQKS